MNVLTLGGLLDVVLRLWFLVLVGRGLWVLWTAWGLEEEIPDPERQIVPGTWVLDGEDS